MQTAAATLAGNALGARDNQRMKDLTRVTLVLEVIMMTISGGLLFIFAPQMMGIFSKDPEVIRLGSIVLRMVALSEPIYGVSIIFEGILFGVGNTVVPFVYNISGMWGVRIVGTFITTRLMGMNLVAAWGCMIAHNFLLFVLFTLHYIRGKWNPLEQK
jgi:Na+-driven multidrug efflux pump